MSDASDAQIDRVCHEEEYNCEDEWVAPPPSTIAESIDVGRELRLLKTVVDLQCGDTPRPPFRYPKPVGPWRKRKRKKGTSRPSNNSCPFRIRLLARPLERHILLTLENYGHLLPARVVEEMRRSLGEEPTFTPKEAYGFFKQMYRKRKIAERLKRRQKKQTFAIRPCTKKHITFTRKASILFARCLQRQLIHPRIYQLKGCHILLANVILNEICGYMKMLSPCRADRRPKQQFMIEMADRITAWIDQIIIDAGLRMLFVDDDEEDDISSEDDDIEGGDDNEEDVHDEEYQGNGEEVGGEEEEADSDSECRCQN